MLVSVGNLFTGERRFRPREAPPMEYHSYPQAGLVPQPQSGLVMVHKLDTDTDTKLNALVDKVATLVSRRTLMTMIVVGVLCFLAGRYLFGMGRKGRRKKRKG